ncbi:cryptochrome/photolyase family protein [Aestuariibaculum lutulentum]|uniref:Cryptochrome/photolyase family protein n=1 Tax=Aestuariibaculum lutulentum TaxID=2920935 RepID=A0ABS9RLU8_9FLAO|nr:cryptochrome/photolyase family protein [Aestuariibaculum lutulentum]MCH4553526.1 cryptochrome/photolyase family protein [Aestuariibaculum lutulentum]
MKTLRLILGDQLNSKHSWYKTKQDNYVYCMFEMRQETDYVTHHIQKITGFFAAMRNFARLLKSKGFQVEYITLDNPKNTQNLVENLNILINIFNIEKFEYQLPDEYRLDEQLLNFTKTLAIPSQAFSTEHFYTKRFDLKTFFKDKNHLLMETFYRHMRKKHNILIVANQPEGGKWNFDKSNRNKWKGSPYIPPYKNFDNEVSNILELIKSKNIKTIGIFEAHTFEYPINREQALSQLKYFCENLLVHFGDYQDAMHTKEVNLYHSRLSFAMNLKLISPKNVVDTVLNYWTQYGKHIQISQVEGFIRQIIGWREYMRGMYWAFMPDYKTLNHLKNTQPLPDFYWTGNTKMNCLKHCITNSLNNGYAHHIQRLMVTGNFTLLAQIHPDEVDKWYLGIYIDAIEWVQLPNTRGMSQFADGGKIATKPYVSSGSYINKMSNYCDSCLYNKNEKSEDNACPFNSLYWNFLFENRNALKDNHRMQMMFNLLDNMDKNQLIKIRARAQKIIESPDEF